MTGGVASRCSSYATRVLELRGLSQCFSTDAFLWGAYASGAICPSCMGQARVQCQWQVKGKGCPIVLGQMT
eukprot:scaffold42486_cov17-Tisochrysis_lutea.AAC.1